MTGGGLLVVRPLEQGLMLARMIRERGGLAWVFPTIEIRPIPVDAQWAASILTGADWLVFVSVNAVECGWPLVQRSLGVLPRLAAVGPTTAGKLAELSGGTVLFPREGADSEALMALPEMRSITGQSVVIVRGKGGREWLRQTLEMRGASVRYLECYERLAPLPDYASLDQAIASEAAVSVMSAESLRNLWQLAGPERQAALQKLHFLVPHPRVAEAARQLGIVSTHVTGAGNAEVLAGWNRLKSQ
jgi:uroporphyrinogen-III synthase